MLLRDFGLGLEGFFRAPGLCLRHGLWWLFLAPIALWLLLAYGMFHGLEAAADAAGAWARSRLHLPEQAGDASWWAALKDWGNRASAAAARWVLRLALGYLLLVANKYIVLVLLSPLMAHASEKAEEALSGRTYPFSLPQLLEDARQGRLKCSSASMWGPRG